MGNIADHIAAAIAIPGSINDKLIGFFAGAVRYGSGSPEGAVSAPIGAVYHRSDGGAGTSVYVKESGSGNTGWKAMITAAASSGVTNKFRRVTANTGLTSLTATSKTAINSPNLDLTIAAAVNDVLVVGAAGLWQSDSIGGVGYLDYATIVSGSVVNWLGGNDPSLGGLPNSRGPSDTSLSHAFEGSARYTVVSGDISGGNVTLRLHYAVSAGNKAIAGSSIQPLFLWVENLGPQAP